MLRNAAHKILDNELAKEAAIVNMPSTLVSVDRNAMMTGEATDFNQW